MLNSQLNQFSEILIIKTGRHETFVDDSGDEISLGDVVRSTSLLRAFSSQQKITWLTSREARPLIQEQSNLKVEILSSEILQEKKSLNDLLVINLERQLEVAKLFPQAVGFCYDGERWLLRDNFGDTYSTAEWKRLSALKNRNSWGACLLNLLDVGLPQTYGVFSKPNVKIQTDIGLNWNVGNKWPSKATSTEFWKKIEVELGSQYSISWQRGLNSLQEYADWLASNRLVISLDSLGLHLAMAMETPAVGLFGATDSLFFDNSPKTKLLSFAVPRDTHHCLPCWEKHCFQKTHCSEYLSLLQLQNAVKSLLA